MRDAKGAKLAKSAGARTLAELRADGWQRRDVLHAIGLAE
jgi:glutamyl/glutaminyl-tRNA synthetase